MAQRQTSDRQKEANRQNAQQSTGPKTEAGKNQSRQNAWRHGLRAEKIVLATEEHQRKEAEAVWNLEIRPHSKAEWDLLDQVVSATIKLNRCKQAERDTLAPHLHEVNQQWERQKKHRVRGQAQRLNKKPAAALKSLQQSAFGCAYLKRQWQTLAEALTDHGTWTAEQQEQALRLTGRDPESPPGPSDPEGQTLFQAARQLSNPRTTREAGASQPRGPGFPSLEGRGLAEDDEAPATPSAQHGDLDPANHGGFPNAKSSDSVTVKDGEVQQTCQFWLDWVAAEQERLSRLEDRLWDEVDGPERQAVLSQALIDRGPTGRQCERLEQRAESSLHRNIKMIIKLRETQYRAEERRDRLQKNNLMPKEYIGDGWWREPDACPVPPGFLQAVQEWHQERHGRAEPFYAGNPDLDLVDPALKQPFEGPPVDQQRLNSSHPMPLGFREGDWKTYQEKKAWYKRPDRERPYSAPPQRGPGHPNASGPAISAKDGLPICMSEPSAAHTAPSSHSSNQERNDAGETRFQHVDDVSALEAARRNRPTPAPAAPSADSAAQSKPNEPISPARAGSKHRPKSPEEKDLGRPEVGRPINPDWRNRPGSTGAIPPGSTAQPSASEGHQPSPQPPEPRHPRRSKPPESPDHRIDPGSEPPNQRRESA